MDVHESDADHALIEAHRSGAADAFAILVRRHTAVLFRYVVHLGHDPQTAEDVVQETFLKAWKSLRRYDAHQSFRGWLFTIARNTAMDLFRKKTAQPFADLDADETTFVETIADTKPLPDALVARQDLGVLITAALATVPFETRSIVLLHDAEGLTFQEIADSTMEPMETVKSRYRRGVLRIRTFLRGKLDQETHDAPKTVPRP